ncbi:MAG: hypothetical protein QJR05_12215 [Thermoanaerobacterium sp.]|nr:hypothetical protein [Thermoanaerobacterium sp.]
MADDKLIYAIEERIGQPDLFTGRKEELSYFERWADEIPMKLSRSTALLSRRKKGKTALVERLYNIIYTKNGSLVPFYFEVKEGSKWIVDFALNFYASFISQYLGFKLRDVNLCRTIKSLDELNEIASKNGYKAVSDNIKLFKDALKDKDMVDTIWNNAQSAPHRIASVTGDYIVQIIDEFQFMNSEIYWDMGRTRVANDLAGSYLSLAESKVAPMLVTGSWVSWLKNIIRGQLPGRFIETELNNLKEEEGLEAIYNYSIITDVPVSDDVALYLNKLVNSDPFYISAIIRSIYKDKDLTTIDGLMKTLNFELRRGSIYGTWMEYIGRTLSTVNDKNAKKIVLFLSKNREKEWTRQEIIAKCNLPYDDREAENKLQMLIKGDLISEGSTSIRYRGMTDDIFYKVFRYKYEEEIDNFPLEKILDEEREKELMQIEALQKEIKSLKGREKYYKGHILEYVLMKYLKFEQYKKENATLKDKVYNSIQGAEFTRYQEVKPYKVMLEGGREHEVDIWAKSYDEGKDLFIEVKSWERSISKSDTEKFVKTVEDMKTLGIKGYFIYYSLNGFEDDAKKYLNENGIMYADKKSWAIV